MGFCIRCGASLVPTSRFCGSCGEPVAAAPIPPPSLDPLPPHAAPAPSGARRTFLPLVLGGALALLVAAMGGAYFYFVRRAPSVGPTTDTAAPPASATPAAAPALASARWLGSERGERDFVATPRGTLDDEALAFDYRATRADGTVETGTLRVRWLGAAGRGPRVRAELVDASGNVVRVYDGIASADRRTLTGAVRTMPASVLNDRAGFFWATLEAAPPAVDALATFDLNSAGVGELESLGFSPRSARVLVEGRLAAGPYLRVEPALAIEGLAPNEQTLLRRRARVH